MTVPALPQTKRMTRMTALALLGMLLVGTAVITSVLFVAHSVSELRATALSRCLLNEAQKADAREDLTARVRQLEALIAADTALKTSSVAPDESDRIFDMRIAAYSDARVAAQARFAGLGQPVDCHTLYG